MKRILPIAYFILLIFITSAQCQTGYENNYKIYMDANVPIVIGKSDKEFAIRLPANPSTGYSWRIKHYDPSAVRLIRKSYQPTLFAKPGAIGYETLLFKINQNRFAYNPNAQIEFAYGHPWNQDIAKVVVFNIKRA